MVTIAPSSRQTTYSPVSPTTTFPVGFPIFDDADIVVQVNPVLPDDVVTDFTVTSTYVNGISTDAAVVLSAAVTGTVIIIGARKPARTDQFQTGRPLKIEDFNYSLNRLEAEMQETWRDAQTKEVTGSMLAAVARAEAAAEQAEEFAATVSFVSVPDIPALQAVDTVHHNAAVVRSLGRVGVFTFQLGDFSARVSADTLNGVIIKANAVSASVGAWVREKYFDYDVQQFGNPADLTSAVSAIETIGGGSLRVPGGVALGSLPTSYGGTTIKTDGPTTAIDFTNGDGHGIAKNAWFTDHNDAHAGGSKSTFHLQSRVFGSGQNGPATTDVGLSLSHAKKNFLTTGQSGELDGLYIILQQGGPSPTTNISQTSDHAGILIDTSSYGNCGHGFAIETITRNFDSSGVLLIELDSQIGGIETNLRAFNPDGTRNANPLGVRFVYGFSSSLLTGTGDVAYLIESASKWTSALRINSLESDGVFDIRNDGNFWQGSGSNRVKYTNNAGSISLLNSSNVSFASFSPASGIIAGDFSAANALRMQGGVAGGSAVKMSSVGVDTNIDIQAVPKGTGGFNVLDTGGTVFASISKASGMIAGDFVGANALRMQGGASGAAAKMSSAGIDTNIDIQIVPKGTGAVNVLDSGSVVYASFSKASGIIAGDFVGANAIRMQGAAAGSAVSLSATGSDTNIDIKASPKGTGTFQVLGTGGLTIGDIVAGNGATIKGVAAGSSVQLTTVGVDTNITLQVVAKGAGALTLGRNTNTLGFFGGLGTVKPTITGSKGANAALASLLTALANMNLITDTTT